MSSIPYIHTADAHNPQAASEIVPYIISLCNPSSVLDVGCGLGDFLKIFQSHGVADILGLDGTWVDTEKLFIDTVFFRVANLEQSFDLGRQFDLVLCLEVAEHLNSEANDVFVQSLCRHADTIVFSAAIPGQGGQNHINEQPFHYWLTKFEAAGYSILDILRHEFWDNKHIHWWYRQNIFLLTKDKSIINRHVLYKVQASKVLTAVHPAYVAEQCGHVLRLIMSLKAEEDTRQSLLDGRYTWRTYLGIIHRKMTKQFYAFTGSKSK